MWEWLYALDVEWLRRINTDWSNPFFDQFLTLAADFRLMKWVLGAGVLALLIWGGFRGRALVFLMIACLLIGDAGINWSIKRLVNRPRPHESVENLRLVSRIDYLNYKVKTSKPRTPERGRSMTSGHACNNFAAAYLITRFFPPWGALSWIWACMIAYSRIYTAAHYPSDIIVSFFVALAYAHLISCAAVWLWQKGAPRLLPQTYARHPNIFP